MKNLENKYVFENVISLVTLTVFAYVWYSIVLLRCHHGSTNKNDLPVRLQEVVLELNNLWKKHRQLILKLQEFPGLLNSSTFKNSTSLPGLNLKKSSRIDEYEAVLRRIYTNTKELWYFLLKKATKNVTKSHRRIIIEEVASRKGSLLSDQKKLSNLDGREEWRHFEAARVSDLVQRRLYFLQNPPDCQAARKLVCDHDIHGFGCRIHHVVYCLIMAYALQRTLILTHYDYNNPNHQWNNIFQPLSDTCTKTYTKNVYTLTEYTHDQKVVYLPYLRKFKDKRIFPYFIPKDLANRIARFNGDPYSWWIGQVVKYVLRLQTWDVINQTIAKTNFDSPIVGVHIRRTDKLKYEALYHYLEEYMYYVEDYYKELELTQPVIQRRVYLATDDASVLKEAIEKYPQYIFYGDYNRAEAASVESRVNLQSLSDFLIDLHLLSLCDHVVCTFSSNIGRMAYELMQTRLTDASTRFTSLDHMYYFTIKEKHYRVAKMHDKYMPLKVGDTIQYKSVKDPIFDAYFRTRQGRFIPWYKTEEMIVEYPYPKYKDVQLFPETIVNTTKTED